MDIKYYDFKELENLCVDIRKSLIEAVSTNGGHLASNLGVVELTTALHYVFESPKDIILWDVGHQSYVHKMLTDRWDRINTIRQYKGLSPFTNPKESKHDHFVAGHAGNSLSAAYGIAEAAKDKTVIAIIGDASLVNGQSLEALNHIGGKAENLIIVINDNGRSIGENVGTIFRFLSRVMSRKAYTNLKNDVEKIFRKISFGNKLADVIQRLEHSLRYFLYPSSILEGLGFNYAGPIDGHNLHELITTFEETKNMSGPIIIHVKTTKGKGYQFAEENQEKFHGVSPFNIETGKTSSKNKSYSELFGDKICEYAKVDGDVIAISAGMIKGTGLTEFSKKYPNQLYDVGIAEEHAVTFAGGLAIKGKKPFVSIYSTFLQRSYDQLIHDIALQKLPVKFILDRAGLVGEDGPTHHGVFDISFLATIPDLQIFAPVSGDDFANILDYCYENNDSPCAIRIPRGEIFGIKISDSFVPGKWIEYVKGEEILIIATGSMFKEVVNIQEDLKKEGLTPTIIAASSIIPMDKKYLSEKMINYKKVFVVEENILNGGLGSLIVNYLNEMDIHKKINKIGIPNKFIEHGKRKILLENLGMTGDFLLKRIIQNL